MAETVTVLTQRCGDFLERGRRGITLQLETAHPAIYLIKRLDGNHMLVCVAFMNVSTRVSASQDRFGGWCKGGEAGSRTLGCYMAVTLVVTERLSVTDRIIALDCIAAVIVDGLIYSPDIANVRAWIL